ncbi:MAG: hypothetical protein J6N52_00605 [Clostridia bacterium]|nr:hypothetical protein [Clostridia bacterium]
MRKEASNEKWKMLYEIASEIKEMKPWEYFWDMDIINLTDEDVYITVLGRGGETYGVSVYEGEKGFDKFKLLVCQQELNISPHMAMYMQDNLTCYWGDREELSKKQRDIIKELGYKYRGKNQWLYFISHKTDYMPYNFDSDEVGKMTKYLSGLKNALELYFKERPQIDFEQDYMLCYSDKEKKITGKKTDFFDFGFNGIQIADNIDLLNDLKKLPKTIGTLEIDILPMFVTINDKSYDRPANPSMSMIVDKKSGMVMAAAMSTPETGIFGNFANTIVSTFFRYGLPKRINICNSITGSLLEELCDILGIKLGYEDELPAIEEAEESLMRFMG